MLIKHRKQSDSGFTLIELLVVIGIIATLAVIATPGLQQWKQNSDLNADMRRLYGFFQKTRLEAVKRNTDCFFVSPQVVNGTAFDYVSFIDTSGNGTYDIGEEVTQAGNFTKGVTVTAVFSGSFDRRGLIDANRTIKLKSLNGTTHDLVMNIRGRMVVK